MTETLCMIARSWFREDGVYSTQELLDWVYDRNEAVAVDIHKTSFADSGFWFYDREEGCIRNQNRSFFTITGFQQTQPDGSVISQPIILQQEIGYLGIL